MTAATFRAGLCATVLLWSMGCGDDGGDGTTTDTAGPAGDTGGQSDVGPGADVAGDVGGDTVTGNPCTPNPCTTGKAAQCSADRSEVVSFETNGTCANSGGTAACTYPQASAQACTAPQVCVTGGDGTGACGTPTDACDYGFSSDVAYLTSLRVASQEDDSNGPPSDDCCFSFDDDSEVDNEVGSLMQLISNLPGVNADPNTVIGERIAEGTVAVLIELLGLDSITVDPELTLNVFYGDDTDNDHANNVAGSGVFTVRKSSFDTGTANPTVTFPGARINGGLLRAGPSLFKFAIPLANGLVIDADIKNTRIEGRVSVGPNGGIALGGSGSDLGAKLGGTIEIGQLFDAFNTFLDTNCACVDQAGGDLIEPDGSGGFECNDAVDSSGCNKDVMAENNCILTVNLCPASLILVKPDIDTDNDNKADSLSVGVWVTATGAAISGVDPAMCPAQ